MTIPDFWTLASAPAVEVLGWTLLHFFWQGALVATLLAGALWVLRRHGPRVRYAVTLAALAALLALPISTGGLLYDRVGSGTTEVTQVDVAETLTEVGTESMVARMTAEKGHLPTWSVSVSAWIRPALPWVVFGWSLGVLMLAFRWVGGAWYVRRTRRSSSAAPAEWRHRLADLARSVGLNVTVALRQSRSIESPMVSGWWRPIVLVPAGILSGLPPREVEALLLHELAHIRRRDVLVGHLQTFVEVLFFFHPATWWVSRRVRIAREACCDDLAVQSGSDRTVVARALAALAERAVDGRTVSWAPAASGGALLRRIRRLLSPRRGPSDAVQRLSMVAAVLLVVGIPLVLAACASQQSATEEESAPAAAEDEVLALHTDSTEGAIRVQPEGKVELDTLPDGTHILRHEGRTDTLDLPAPPEMAPFTHPPLPFDPDSFSAAILDQLDVEGIERAVRMRVDADSLARIVEARINPDSLQHVIRMRIDRDSIDREVFEMRLRADSLARWHREHADSLHRRMEEIRERMESGEGIRPPDRTEMPERLREQARRLREQADRLEERAREMETPESGDESDSPPSESVTNGGKTG